MNLKLRDKKLLDKLLRNFEFRNNILRLHDSNKFKLIKNKAEVLAV